MHLGDFLLQRHAAEQVINPLLEGLIGVKKERRFLDLRGQAGRVPGTQGDGSQQDQAKNNKRTTRDFNDAFHGSYSK